MYLKGKVSYYYNMNDEISRHRIYKDICNLSYKKKKLFDKYNILDENHDDGIDAYAILIGNYIIVAYQGTDVFEGKDWRNDTVMAINREPKQFNQAFKFFNSIKNDERYRGHQFVVTGYSLGGSEAMAVAVTSKCDEVVTFNPYGIKNIDYVKDYIRNYGIATPLDKIINYNMSEDTISGINIEDEIGKVYMLDGSNPLFAHYLDNFPDLSTRELMDDVQPTQLKRELWNFLDIIKFLSQKKSILLNATKEYLLNYLKRKQKEKLKNSRYHSSDYKYYEAHGTNSPTIKPSMYSSTKQCAGIYHVNGYTREYGTKVSDYYRTCGAKHLNKR